MYCLESRRKQEFVTGANPEVSGRKSPVTGALKTGEVGVSANPEGVAVNRNCPAP